MSYTPTTWNTGDTITATKLNKIENGIANAGGVLHVGISNNTLDKTCNEIWDALESGTLVYLSWFYGDRVEGYQSIVWNCPITTVYKYNTTYTVIAERPADNTGQPVPAVLVFSVNDLNGYAVFRSKRLVNYASTATSNDMNW